MLRDVTILVHLISYLIGPTSDACTRAKKLVSYDQKLQDKGDISW